MPLFGPNIEKMKQRRDAAGLVKLLSGSNPQLRILATRALGGLENIDGLRQAIGSKDTAVCIEAIKAAIELEWIDGLLLALRSSNTQVRVQAIEALLEVRDSKAIDPLVGVLVSDGNQTVQQKGLEALTRFELGDAAHWISIGVSLLQGARHPAALACFDKADSSASGDKEILNSIGTTLSDNGIHDNALKFAERLIETVPEDARGWELKGVCLYGLGQTDQAASICQRALEINPDLVKAKDILTDIDTANKLADLLDQCESDPDAGLVLLEEMIQKSPELSSHPHVKFAKAMAYGCKGVIQIMRERGHELEIEVGYSFSEFDKKDLKDAVGLADSHLDFLEKGLHELDEMEQTNPGALLTFGELGETRVDNMAMALERCRPGRVQEILGKTKLWYYGPERTSVSQHCEVTKREFEVIRDIWFTSRDIAKSAVLSLDNRDEEGRFIAVGLYTNESPSVPLGENNKMAGGIYLYTNGTFKQV